MELYVPRTVTGHGQWEVAGLRMKIFGLCAAGREIDETVLAGARAFLDRDLPGRVAAQGESDGLGFVIVHAGAAGLTVSAYWWVMGSVLCQTLHRVLPSGAAAYPDDHPVVGCVWELGLVSAEQTIWRDTMMVPDADPDRYLATRPPLSTV